MSKSLWETIKREVKALEAAKAAKEAASNKSYTETRVNARLIRRRPIAA